VITGNIFSMPEVAGEAACLVNPLDVNDIRNGILKILNDENYRSSLVVNGFKNTERFSTNEIVRKYTKLYSLLF